MAKRENRRGESPTPPYTSTHTPTTVHRWGWGGMGRTGALIERGKRECRVKWGHWEGAHRWVPNGTDKGIGTEKEFA